MKVLIVDDEIDILELLEQECREKRFAVATASNGRHAVKAVEQLGPFEVLITDINMPQMDGIELISWMEKNAPQTKIIVMTASIAANSRFHLAPEYHLVMKPFRLEDITGKLETWRRQHNARQET